MCRTCRRSWNPVHGRYLDTDGKFREITLAEDDRQEHGTSVQIEEEKLGRRWKS